MKWRHWAILIVLLLLNYILFSTAFTLLAEQRRVGAHPTRTPLPTFDSVESNPVAWLVLPTNTPQPTRTPVLPTPIEATLAFTESTPIIEPVGTLVTSAAEAQPTASPPPPATDTPVPPTATPLPPTATPTSQTTFHTVKAGDTLTQIAGFYGVTVQAIVTANNLSNADQIYVGQVLRIPAPGQSPAAPTPRPQPANTPKPKPPSPTPTRKPPTPTSAPPAPSFQFTGNLLWDPQVAPNCAGPAISKMSIIRDVNGNPVNGARVEVNCYNNVWLSHLSGTPGEYDPGHYDFSFGQGKPQNWICTARVFDVNGQPVASSAVVTIQFDTNNCKPNGNGHQVAILNWTKHW